VLIVVEVVSRFQYCNWVAKFVNLTGRNREILFQ